MKVGVSKTCLKIIAFLNQANICCSNCSFKRSIFVLMLTIFIHQAYFVSMLKCTLIYVNLCGWIDVIKRLAIVSLTFFVYLIYKMSKQNFFDTML